MKEKIKELGKRLLTIAVALAMVVTCIPGTAFGAETSEKVKKNVRVPDTFTLGVTLDGIESTPLGDYDYKVPGLDASKIAEGSVIEGTFTVSVLASHSAKTGYLKINSLTATK